MLAEAGRRARGIEALCCRRPSLLRLHGLVPTPGVCAGSVDTSPLAAVPGPFPHLFRLLLQVPDALLPDDAVEALVAERQPRFVPLDGASSSGADLPRSADGTVGAAGHGGVVQLRLSNGIKVNYRRTDNEPRGAMLRLVAAGGRATEGRGAGPLGAGVMALGTRTLSEAGTVGAWSREQVWPPPGPAGLQATEGAASARVPRGTWRHAWRSGWLASWPSRPSLPLAPPCLAFRPRRWSCSASAS